MVVVCNEMTAVPLTNRQVIKILDISHTDTAILDLYFNHFSSIFMFPYRLFR